MTAPRGLATAAVLLIATKSVTLTESYLDKLLFAFIATLQHYKLLRESCEVGNSCHYQLNWKVDESQSQSGHCGEANNLVSFDVHGSMHHNTILIKVTNKMQQCRIIYYSTVPWLLYMFRATLSLIIRSILTVITASGFIHMYCCRLLSWLSHDSSQQQYM
jgi:hypothetical protein